MTLRKRAEYERRSTYILLTVTSIFQFCAKNNEWNESVQVITRLTLPNGLVMIKINVYGCIFLSLILVINPNPVRASCYLSMVQLK